LDDSFNLSELDINPDGEILSRQQHNRFEYCYSLKMFGNTEVVYEREPHRVLDIQDPILYRGQLGALK